VKTMKVHLDDRIADALLARARRNGRKPYEEARVIIEDAVGGGARIGMFFRSTLGGGQNLWHRASKEIDDTGTFMCRCNAGVWVSADPNSRWMRSRRLADTLPPNARVCVGLRREAAG